MDFRYLDERVREPSGLDDTPANRTAVRRQLDLVIAEIDNGVFKFAERFPHSKKKEHFSRLEGKTLKKGPEEVLFGDYQKQRWEEMGRGMSPTQIRDYASILKNHLLPYFEKMAFCEFKPVAMKKFLAYLKTRKNRYGQPISPKRIHNVLIPLRVIVRDAIDEFGWTGMLDPFRGLKLPKGRRLRIQPFSYEEWATLMKFMPPWYRPYFEFAVQTGLRPSEQVALKWTAIDYEFIHIELSRVRNEEKIELKTERSARRIDVRPSMQKILKEQGELTGGFSSTYVFLNAQGRPVRQEKVGEVWQRAMTKSGLPYRRPYETRHTFASWALAAGESPEWVARTLGHVNAAMLCKTYGRYIPNLTRQDGSAFERRYVEAKKSNPKRHNLRHNC